MLSLFTSRGRSSDLDEWTKTLAIKSREFLFQNISPPGSPAGIVIAAPTKYYYFHWVRDSALVMDVVVTLYIKETDPTEKNKLFTLLMDYASLSRTMQLTPNKSGGPGDGGDGEVKFNADGTPFMGDWGRPQNDGPASRAITLTRFAFQLIAEGKINEARKLYDGKIPADSVIKADLEYTAHHWIDSGIDLWEEIWGNHFYTRFVQRKALLDGAHLADALGDTKPNGGARDSYREQVKLLEVEIKKHDGDKKHLLATLDESPNDKGKQDNLDVAVILAFLYNQTPEDEEGFFALDNEMLLATAVKLLKRFKSEYAINKIEFDHFGQRMQVAVGRYLGDKYDGYDPHRTGNHWFLATAAFSELCYSITEKLSKKKRIEITELNKEFYQFIVDDLHIEVGDVILESDPRFKQMTDGMFEGGERFVRRTRYHAKDDFEFHEQSNRDTGVQQGVENLTWNCSAHMRFLDRRSYLQILLGF